jgi:hypothetical protein
MNMENIKDMGNVNGVNMRKGMAIDRRNEQLRRGGATMKSDKMNDGTIVFASYWTTVEMSDRLVAVRFRFPMEFGLLRAADWAEKEISEAACWLALHRRVQGDLATRLRFMMPRHSGKRKVMHHTRMMELTVGMGRYQIEMVLKRKSDCEAMSDEIDDAMECMVAWMRENAYMRQMQ